MIVETSQKSFKILQKTCITGDENKRSGERCDVGPYSPSNLFVESPEIPFYLPTTMK